MAMAEKAKPKKKPLNIRERKFIKALIAGKTPTQAMRDAGYKESMALSRATDKLVETRDTIQEIMERRGITDDRLSEVLEKGLEATKVISATIVAKNGEGMKDADSMSKDFIDVEDYAVRHKYLETGLKLKNYLKDKVDVTHSNPDGTPINITITLVEAKNA